MDGKKSMGLGGDEKRCKASGGCAWFNNDRCNSDGHNKLSIFLRLSGMEWSTAKWTRFRHLYKQINIAAINFGHS